MQKDTHQNFLRNVTSIIGIQELFTMEIVIYKWRTIHICLYKVQKVDFHQWFLFGLSDSQSTFSWSIVCIKWGTLYKCLLYNTCKYKQKNLLFVLHKMTNQA